MSKGTAYTRCPTCGTRGSRIQYGLRAGPPGRGVVLGGCIIGPDNPDYMCEACRASWCVTTGGHVIIVDPGSPRRTSQTDA